MIKVQSTLTLIGSHTSCIMYSISKHRIGNNCIGTNCARAHVVSGITCTGAQILNETKCIWIDLVGIDIVVIHVHYCTVEMERIQIVSAQEEKKINL
jgi:hypothetical protein